MFENKKIIVLGFARSGYEACKFLSKYNNEIILNDMKKEHDKEKQKELENLGIKMIFGEHPDDLIDETVDYLIKNPGVPIKHKYCQKAQELNIPVINEAEMAFNMIPKDKNIKLISITGSNGKTTTTTLINKFLTMDNKRNHLSGNIGYPVCSFIEKLKQDDIIVMEISAQQLYNIKNFEPDIAVYTNISEAHLEFFETFENYVYAKSRLVENQTKEDLVISNNEDEILHSFIKDKDMDKLFYSSKNKTNGSYLKEGIIYYKDEPVINTKDIKLRGIHNYENIMAAITAVKEFNVSNESIEKVLKEFKGVEHRLEYVCEKEGTTYYNDTEATNIKCTQIALASFTEPTILILGGYERNQKFEDLLPYSKNIKMIIGIGSCRQRVIDFANQNNIESYSFENLKDAMQKIKEESKPGDVVLLSPASASWDQYKQCEDRGAEFKKIANSF